MEIQALFDLNHAIQQWRENLAQAPAFRNENLDELESHLRDSVATLQTHGLSAGESFMVATKRIGDDPVLTTEFGKVNGKAVWLDRILWGLIGIQIWNWVGTFSATLASNFVFSSLSRLGYNSGAHGVVIPVTLLTLAHLLAFGGSLAVCWWLTSRCRQGLVSRARRLLQTIGGAFAATIFVLGLLGLAVLLLGAATQLVPLNGSDRPMYAVCGQYGSAIFMVIQAITLVALTLFLARKRLCASQA